MRDLRPGTIVSYGYLWKWQRDRAETEGRKERPVCVVVAVQGARDAATHLALIAISSRPPDPRSVGAGNHRYGAAARLLDRVENGLGHDLRIQLRPGGEILLLDPRLGA